MSKPYWRRLPLTAMNQDQWEDLCDGCGLCCLHKLEDEDNGRVYYTQVACRLLDLNTCRCTDYENRLAQIPDCLTLNPDNVRELDWLPDSCSYRLVAYGQPLPAWHPLISKDPNARRKAGVSACNFAISEHEADLDNLEHYIID